MFFINLFFYHESKGLRFEIDYIYSGMKMDDSNFDKKKHENRDIAIIDFYLKNRLEYI